MSNRDINPFDWYRSLLSRRGTSWGGDFFDDMFREFDEMRKDMREPFQNNLKILKTAFQKI